MRNNNIARPDTFFVSSIPEVIREVEMLDGFNILGLVTVSIGFGVAINNMGAMGKLLQYTH